MVVFRCVPTLLFLALHTCANRKTATYNNAFYALHTSHQIYFGISRCGA